MTTTRLTKTVKSIGARNCKPLCTQSP